MSTIDSVFCSKGCGQAIALPAGDDPNVDERFVYDFDGTLDYVEIFHVHCPQPVLDPGTTCMAAIVCRTGADRVASGQSLTVWAEAQRIAGFWLAEGRASHPCLFDPYWWEMGIKAIQRNRQVCRDVEAGPCDACREMRIDALSCRGDLGHKVS